MSLSVYKKRHPRSQFESPNGWIPGELNTLAVQRAGIWSSQRVASYCPIIKKRLDVRYLDQDAGTGEINIPSLISGTLASWAPIWTQQASAFRTAAKPSVGAVSLQHESIAWLDASLSLVDPTTTTTWAGGRPLTIYKKVYPRLNFEQTSWITPLAIASIPSWAGIFQNQTNSFSTIARPSTDVRTIQFDQSAAYIQNFLDSNVGASPSQYGPAVSSQNASFRTKEGAFLDPRWQQLKERKFGIPFNPALFLGALAQASQAGSYCPPAVNRLMGPYSIWGPDAGIFQAPLTLPIQQQSAVHAQLAASFRTRERQLLDVRLSPSHPTTGWEVFRLDPLLQVWAPAFAQLVNSYRSTSRGNLDPRGIYYDEFGWLDSALGLTDPPKKKLSDHRLTIMGVGR
jgi:hypothetical protein